MHIAITHGYILQGTGSNLYVQNLCCELCCAGHTISLFCQESSPEQLDFVAEAVDFDEANEKHTRFNRETEYTGKCTFYRPNIGKLLPVYVYDDYAGFVVKEYTELTVEEIETYIERNVHALKSVFTDNPPDLLISNHLIMQPVYGVRATRDIPACKRFTIVHGSALNFSVRNSTLLEKYAHEAIAGSDRIIVDSSHARNELFEFFSNDPEIVNRTSIIPPGVDLDKFIPVNSVNDKPHRIGSLVEKLHQKQTEGKGRTADEKAVYDRAVSTTEIGSPTRELIDELNRNTDQWTPDHDVADNLETINWLDDPVVLYYGKYLWTKGIHLLISAAPIVLQKYPNARFLIVGFGSFRGYLEALVAALEHNRRDLFIDMISHPDLYNDAVDINSTLYFQDLLEKLKDKDFADSYFNTAAGLISSRIIFTGILTHDFLKDLIPCSEITVAMSIFPEAFGMVAVEALASGVIPLQTNHSGFADVIEAYVKEFSDTFDSELMEGLHLDKQLVLKLADYICKLLDKYRIMSEDDRLSIRRRANRICHDNYSWKAVAQKFLNFV